MKSLFSTRRKGHSPASSNAVAAASSFGISQPKQGQPVSFVMPGDPQAQAMQGYLPGGGQMINVAVNAASPHLSFREWMARGIVGGIGNVAAFPFRFVGRMIEAIGHALIGIVKLALIILLIPTLIWLGIKLQSHVSQAPDVKTGTEIVVQDARDFASGVKSGASKDDAAKPAK